MPCFAEDLFDCNFFFSAFIFPQKYFFSVKGDDNFYSDAAFSSGLRLEKVLKFCTQWHTAEKPKPTTTTSAELCVCARNYKRQFKSSNKRLNLLIVLYTNEEEEKEAKITKKEKREKNLNFCRLD